ncbi:MAG: signal peptidase I [Actinomycetaceae bacterium]|nr:signal peptidase I [Actinomycetaceae bacterium]
MSESLKGSHGPGDEESSGVQSDAEPVAEAGTETKPGVATHKEATETASELPKRSKGPRHSRHSKDGTGQTTENKKRGPLLTAGILLRDLVVIIALALLISGVTKAFLLQTFRIPSGSMEQTLVEGDRIMVEKLSPLFAGVKRGEITVFKDSDKWLSGIVATEAPTGFFATEAGQKVDKALQFIGFRPEPGDAYLIKRVIGVEGDRVKCCDTAGYIEVNGKAIKEPYLNPDEVPYPQPFDVTVPPGKIWVMGDNRNHSGDSRAHVSDPSGGFIDTKEVVGTPILRIWPLDRVGVMSKTDAFKDVEP